MRRLAPLVLGLSSATALLAACPPTQDDDDDDASSDDPCAGVEAVSGTDVTLDPVASGFDNPVHVTHAGDGTGRIFVVEQGGTIRSIGSDGDLSDFLDISDRVQWGGEMGLLSVAFHPDFESNGRLFVDYTDDDLITVVSEFTVPGDPLSAAADPSSERVLFEQQQPAANHNGGQLAFGPDGYLYIGFGDGGGAGDTYGNSQKKDSWLAKILRIDVDAGAPYSIPADNPFVDDTDFLPEIWAWGMRNPWRFSFDRETGELWAGDVGQDDWEEVDVIRSGGNYGWVQVEGMHCYEPGCDRSAYEAPVWEYPHSQGISITGGFVYRGCVMPDLVGSYVFSDFNYFDSPLWSLSWDGETASQGPLDLNSTGTLISSFGEDEQGEILIADYSDGRVLRIVPD
jgi:glucose/arabinose dehydrogenase